MQFANIGLPEVTIVLPRLAFGKSKVFDSSSSGFSFEGNDFSGLLFGFSGSQRSFYTTIVVYEKPNCFCHTFTFSSVLFLPLVPFFGDLLFTFEGTYLKFLGGSW